LGVDHSMTFVGQVMHDFFPFDLTSCTCRPYSLQRLLCVTGAFTQPPYLCTRVRVGSLQERCKGRTMQSSGCSPRASRPRVLGVRDTPL
jgi:hypothetical protein